MVDLRNSIRPATVAASIEAAPKQVLELADLGSLFPQGTRVYLPDTGNVPLAAQVEAARRVTAAGYVAVPHIPVRRIESRGAMATRLARLSQDAGVREALVIAGDADRPAGPFASTMDALGSGMFADHGITTIAVAGHPEGNPHASEDELERAIVWKNAFAARSGTDMRIVTQFCFDPRRVIAWSRRIARSGNRLPIHVGVAGPAKISTLVKYAGMCGVGASLSVLRQRGMSLSVLATSYSPEATLAPIDAHCAAEPGAAIAQAHIYPFGGLRRTAEWLTARGTWTFGAVEDGTVAAEAGQ
ncbi:methylenetetrahydrofolate reductase [Amorphus orientalis]|uniref:Methylenetetrahydrofolate reductase (NADPH) n=1 Tax=Amorphus orientalis TaxID=649198 RepID=A0AAE4AU48_9HYPH|nr:methylenetetrahydrofolate reductase [Amorphus orientalis]MDQ0316950.1 methylenetetrahydrofolate reductase (NADPH) [Amorphus orientalis]